MLSNFARAGNRCLITRRVVGLYCFSRKQSLVIMEAKGKSVYEEAVYALNGLQSNSSAIQKAREERSTKAYLNLVDTERHLKTLGVNLQDLDALNIIHVAGTKGKGSTCAFTEAILRKHGFKTGFYSSPHLISVNERIRINGKPISKEIFAEYFWEVYKSIQSSLKDGESMPAYFLFLTVMSFYIFVKEQIQAAVVEVGIGGLWDCTNIVRRPVAVGITTLGIDHVNILGETIAEIAEQKAGILKPNVPAFTVPQQESAMRVLREKAAAVKCPLLLSPPVEAYENAISLGIQGIVQNVNASLALQLTNTWLRQGKGLEPLQDIYHNFSSQLLNEESHLPILMANTFLINSNTKRRFQTVKKGKVNFFLDGAHTLQSMKYCARWFAEESLRHRENTANQTVLRILLFNCTGERKAESLLDPLADISFDVVMFSPNRINVMKDASSDLSNFMVEPEKEIQQCVTNKEIWCHLMRSLYENELSASSASMFSPRVETMTNCSMTDNTLLFPSISNALNFIFSPESVSKNDKINTSTIDSSICKLVKNADNIQVLVTGSLHLVGGVLSFIDT
ncbi:Folylpolyglutamate synthase, mitochondrial [Araneus ventricosus]|uniref:Folylpolyglutamate synthase n=2 Tax=Araneus ventricosus TaxID=182803 RepID=A0A4Y2S0S3_ARAVE|nr:Folylpolyglutamate synthase, mitochondrial [Araneus ventricosus]